jgi:hypothetical protein
MDFLGILIYLLNVIVFIYSVTTILNFVRSLKVKGANQYPLDTKNKRQIPTTKGLIFKVGIVSYVAAIGVSAYLILRPVFNSDVSFSALDLLLSWIFIYNGIMGTKAFEIRENGIIKDAKFFQWSKVKSYKVMKITKGHKHYGLGEPGKSYVDLEIELIRLLKIFPSKINYLIDVTDSAALEQLLERNVGETVKVL